MNINEIFEDFSFQKNWNGEDVGYLKGTEVFASENETTEISYDFSKYIYGQSIVDIIEEESGERLSLVLSNGLILEVCSNEGCGGCGNGWYTYSEVIDTGAKGNIITKVEVEQPECSDWGTYTLFIYSNDKRILQTDFSGSDNGYYGVGIYMNVKISNETLIKLSTGEGI